ncbi:MAG: CDP-alcohol phosphatidyltransferase family protein [Gammaproteobacteria bacterium]|nr:CDP-alcohol phosphatidyltransferase family protein [Gammaproteobacteria bacterium]MCW8957927.1 CDP-alcohol phosphatidyltransferase family protein [Gammaproteobacteria bacterium]MCW8973714.1 CDP-alcohol phosphatidyltransferase family protein [Gammaproteobacteria bacterium]MCW8993295.1 CDP-alcohol phosphatidyltransferase family protein [Gammaproteobacteria bacterium]MCW9089434.1 CDP-alcohol phosphatidyltransferase family protein [Gammaproteobacteria bacterium]
MKPRHIPNLISVLRIMLVVPIMVLLARGEYLLVLMLFVVAGLSDSLDGYLARRFDWRSQLGALLDPLGDKFLLVGVYLVLGWNGLLPGWLVGLVILRDVVIVSGALAYRRLCGELTMEPTLISKANTLLQIVLGLMVITSALWSVLPEWSLPLMIILVAVSTVWSGLDYVLRWSWRARRCRSREGIE